MDYVFNIVFFDLRGGGLMIHDDSLTQDEQFDLWGELISFYRFYP